MQVLKEELRQSILRKAKESFFEQGFDKTSMKDIAVKLDVSVGNLYRYFPNKEALFDAVVLPAYESLTRMIQHHEHNVDEKPSGIFLLEAISDILSELLQEHREGLLIILDGSIGTRHERAKDHLFDLLTEHLLSHFADFNQHNDTSETLDLAVARPIAVAFFEGFFEIIRQQSDPKLIHKMTKQFVTVMFMGIQQLIEPHGRV
ncbi:TetR/AcrR family transcriptional regulator [Paenibacillus sp. N3.4]|uniref:TetR/AcrR family transcriptional regulator n=1 Tax=Paenibacillus sp. N3.4 TaxID=2603222 RepID=UPI001650C542|nr:TetR/AcrR family transcriptional regulator [Paenibacillus sp. N3.4]